MDEVGVKISICNLLMLQAVSDLSCLAFVDKLYLLPQNHIPPGEHFFFSF